MLLDAGELEDIQADAVAAACDQSCQIQRKTLTLDNLGQGSEVWSTTETTVGGMTEPTANQLQNYDYLIGSLAAWLVKLPVSTSVQHQDHLLIGGKTLVVQRILTPRSYPALLTVLASEVE